MKCQLSPSLFYSSLFLSVYAAYYFALIAPIRAADQTHYPFPVNSLFLYDRPIDFFGSTEK